MPSFHRRREDPKNVAAIILGGGAGTQLFPLTSRAATPAVRIVIFMHNFAHLFGPNLVILLLIDEHTPKIYPNL